MKYYRILEDVAYSIPTIYFIHNNMMGPHFERYRDQVLFTGKKCIPSRNNSTIISIGEIPWIEHTLRVISIMSWFRVAVRGGGGRLSGVLTTDPIITSRIPVTSDRCGGGLQSIFRQLHTDEDYITIQEVYGMTIGYKSNAFVAPPVCTMYNYYYRRFETDATLRFSAEERYNT